MSKSGMRTRGTADLLQVDALHAAFVPHAALRRAGDRHASLRFDRRWAVTCVELISMHLGGVLWGPVICAAGENKREAAESISRYTAE